MITEYLASPRKDTAKMSSSGTSSLQTSVIEAEASNQAALNISAAANILEEKVNLLHKDQEIDCLKSEIKDLSGKLETIRIKRAEDQIKIKECEKTKIQLQQLLEHKARISDVQADLQRQLTHAKKEAKEAIEAKEQHAEEMSDLAEAMEMATLDKEMAEEKSETLQQELEHTKEKLEELQIDIEILKSEMSEKGTGGSTDSYQVKQLEQQNERLKEALVKMKDLTAHEKQEQQRNLKEIERQKSEITELSRTKEKLSTLVDDYEKQIAELKEQVDASLGCEEMVEQLTVTNLTLEDKVRDLQVMVDDLERLQDVNEQLQEQAQGTELELCEEVDLTKVKVVEAQRRIEVLHEAIADYEQTIQKFRDQTEQLRDANQELHMQLQKESDRIAMATPVGFVDFKIKYAETEAFARAVETDLRRLKVQEANRHVIHLCSFMPDNFFSRGSDHDAILVLLLISRIITKAEILISQTKEKFPVLDKVTADDVLRSYKIDQGTFSNRFLFKLHYLQSLLHQYSSSLNNCSVELFMKIGTLHMEMDTQEKALDFYIELLRKDQLDENVNLETLDKALTYFQSLYSVHLSTEKVDCSALMADHIKLLMAACDSIHLDISSVKVVVENKENEFITLLKDIATYTDDIRQFLKKIRRRLPSETSSVTLLFGADNQEKLALCRENLRQVMMAACYLRKSAVQQVAMSGDAAFIGIEKIKKLVYESTEKAYGKDGCGLDCMRQSMNEVMIIMSRLSGLIQEGEYEIDAMSQTKSIPPVYLRAQAVKSEAKDLESLKFKLDAHDNDINELKKLLKTKSDELGEMNVRKEMAVRKLQISSKDSGERIERIQRQLDEAKMLLKNKEKEFEETLDHLQADIDALETERGELKDKLKLISKKALLEGLSKTSSLASFVASPASPTIPSSMTTSSHISRDASILQQQVRDLQQDLKHVKNENIQLQSRQMLKQLLNLPALKIPLKPVGLTSTTGFMNMIDLKAEETKLKYVLDLAKKSSELYNEVLKLSCTTVVDISQCKPGSSPATEKISPKNHLIEATTKLQSLQNQVRELQSQASKLKTSQTRGGQIFADFSKFSTSSFKKSSKEDKQLAAKLSLNVRQVSVKSIPIPITEKNSPKNHLIEATTKLLSLQNQIRELQTQAIQAKEQHAEQISDLTEAMEMAMLDKEIAEEKSEDLQQDFKHSKEKLKVLQIDIEILKREMSEKGLTDSFQVKQLEKQNERLKEALVKIVLTALEQQEQQRNLKEIERQKSVITELSRTKEKLSTLVDDYEKQIAELKEQVDASLECKKTVEQLTETNLTLKNKVRDLKKMVDDLERLQDVNEQLQEQAKETELELREEVDMAKVKVVDAQCRIEVLHEAIADYEQTIQKFRDQTEQLQFTYKNSIKNIKML